MSDGQPVTRRAAEVFGLEFRSVIHPICDRHEFAGSIRRGKQTVRDIEIVCILRPGWQERGKLAEWLEAEVGYKRPLLRDGPFYKQLEWGGMKIDLFCTTPAKWGVIFTQRTGSAEFTHWLVSKRPAGAMPRGMRCQNGRIWRGDTVLETPEEPDVFKAIGLTYLWPDLRTGAAWGAAEGQPDGELDVQRVLKMMAAQSKEARKGG